MNGLSSPLAGDSPSQSDVKLFGGLMLCGFFLNNKLLKDGVGGQGRVWGSG